MLGLLVSMCLGHINCSTGMFLQIGVVGQKRRRRSQETWEVVVWNDRMKLEMDATVNQTCPERNSVGRCVIPCAFFGKSVKHIFSCSKMYPD